MSGIKHKNSRDFPDGPEVKTALPMCRVLVP